MLPHPAALPTLPGQRGRCPGLSRPHPPACCPRWWVHATRHGTASGEGGGGTLLTGRSYAAGSLQQVCLARHQKASPLQPAPPASSPEGSGCAQRPGWAPVTAPQPCCSPTPECPRLHSPCTWGWDHHVIRGAAQGSPRRSDAGRGSARCMQRSTGFTRPSDAGRGSVEWDRCNREGRQHGAWVAAPQGRPPSKHEGRAGAVAAVQQPNAGRRAAAATAVLGLPARGQWRVHVQPVVGCAGNSRWALLRQA
jgi:hypothetical protein